MPGTLERERREKGGERREERGCDMEGGCDVEQRTSMLHITAWTASSTACHAALQYLETRHFLFKLPGDAYALKEAVEAVICQLAIPPAMHAVPREAERGGAE